MLCMPAVGVASVLSVQPQAVVGVSFTSVSSLLIKQTFVILALVAPTLVCRVMRDTVEPVVELSKLTVVVFESSDRG